ncbi:MAG: ABC transporter [Micrococcales bacterium]|nr:MAG: ABC transporter [Micrococcales bacterium]
MWNPLPTLSAIALLPLSAVWPAVTGYALAGGFVSALSMAGAVTLVARSLRQLLVPTTWRRILTGLCAIQPMILLYAGNGMSEAMMLCWLMMTITGLIDWVQNPRPAPLMLAGLGLGLTYLTRYEAVAPALAVTAFVGYVSWARADGGRSYRLHTAIADAALVALPAAFTFGAWAALSKSLVNQWFATFSSEYGNSAQVQRRLAINEQEIGGNLAETAGFLIHQLFILSPLLLPILLVAVVAAVRSRQLTAAVPLLVLGSVLLFDNAVTLSGNSLGWLRFQIAVIPLTVFAAGIALVGLQRSLELSADPTGRRAPVTLAVMLSLLAMVAAAIPWQMQTLTNHSGTLAREEQYMLKSWLNPAAANPQDHAARQLFTTEREIAGYLDDLNLPEGSVLTDTAYSYSVVLASRHPTQFVITSDRDFTQSVQQPRQNGVQYFLVADYGGADAVRTHYPDLLNDGAGIATLQKRWDAYLGTWSLYHVP